MIFGPTPLAEARGAVLAHTVRMTGKVLKKGTVLDEAAIAALQAGGHGSIIAARLEPGDVPEDEAADRLANALMGPLLARSRASTGRVNLMADAAGLLVVNPAAIDRINALDESLTIATLANYVPVAAKEMVATIKVIPFAVPGAVLQVAEAQARQAGQLGGPVLAVRPFRPLKVGLVLTELPGVKESVMEGAVEVTRGRVEALCGTLLPAERVRHETPAIADALNRLRRQGAQVLLIAGASAVVDRRDVGPAAIVRAGGAIDHFGMPVDPGNLICLGHIDDIPALVLPGCAKSPKLNGIDWVLQRIFAGLAVTARDVMGMGVGGLLKEIEVRPLPRAEAANAPAPAVAPRRGRQVAALVLAAGRSRRMAPLNKLLVTDDTGVPMVTRVVDNVLASRARPVVVVTGYERERVEEALTGRGVIFAHAEDYAEGLSASLKAGLAALPKEVEGVVICLGDMPLVAGPMIDRLLAAFDPEEGRAIVMPTFRGKQGNPMLWAREFLPEMMSITGDVGARHLVGKHADRVAEVEMADDAVLRDFDTTDALKKAPGFAGAVR
ncbi:molybdopterin-binding/glycosyltransferase family 2 protein [Siccirubricoccus sp. KC 17139]|uniref:Molybdopterin-binding/glycosyltransferase family 2 protein n=1 Tax=Siccirubricoccus soli TaxID=2899147 RepID=A0ABT1D6X5_9PROT|nr:molybdopterin-binding/glycosyltransferase family 2 protein [Siccirubricoccus soli]MCO6417687.1 molybdopterin-binding/glycosyltransferase family 2 protein [Siccirubricoccus soli]MCP2683822.1 molybdopterin-binding/glycosyltransferase family 2 protein [Siccirubricoccus soli]